MGEEGGTPGCGAPSGEVVAFLPTMADAHGAGGRHGHGRMVKEEWASGRDLAATTSSEMAVAKHGHCASSDKLCLIVGTWQNTTNF